MEDNNAAITEFDFSLIDDFFRRLDRQGPGSDEQTLLALSFVDNKPQVRSIADIGCGTGKQTSVLAQFFPKAAIDAVDLLPNMIQGAEKRLGCRIHTILSSMDHLELPEEHYDLIWSEGAIDNMGFSEGLVYWHQFLKQGGYIAVSDMAWLGDERPEQMDWLTNNAPRIDTIEHKVQIMKDAGYHVVYHFTLPEYCWIDNYYQPMALQFEPFLADHPNNPLAVDFVERLKIEIAYYQQYGHTYGYEFFVGRKK